MTRIKEMMNFIKTNSNPQQAVQTMIMNNPSVKQASDIIQQYGGDGKKAFYDLANQKGINPDDILNMLK